MTKKKEEQSSSPLDFTAMDMGGVPYNNSTQFLNSIYGNRGGFGVNTRHYTSDMVKEWLLRPEHNSRNLVRLSRYLTASSSYYMRFMYYMSRMLTLDYVVTSNNTDREYMLKNAKEVQKEYMEALKYVESFNIKHEFGKILYTMVVEDAFFGYERETKKYGDPSITIQRFPQEHCRIVGVKDGIFIFEYDMGVFGYNVEKLKSYPRDFEKMYKKYIETGENWQLVNPKKSVCFKFRDDIPYIFPPFAGIIPEILDYQDVKDILKSKTKLENYKLLLQKIPFKDEPRSENDYLINLKSVKMFHDNIKSTLPDEIGLITSPMDIEEYSFERKNNSMSNIAKDGREEIFDSAGILSGLFTTAGNKSSTALIKAIQTDEAIMFHILRQFERFFNNRLYYRFKGASFQVVMPDITVYNREDKSDEYLKAAQYGASSKLMVSAATGLSASQIVGMAIMENDILNLDEVLVPLQSSHTMSGNKKESGGQEKSINKLSDKGVETRDRDSNAERL